MPTSQTPLDIENYFVRALHFVANENYAEDGDTPSGEIAVDYIVFTHPEDSLRFQVAMSIDIATSEATKNEPYSLHLDLYGFFRFKLDTEEEIVQKMLFSNAVPMLFGIARGCVGQATATAFNGPLMLPPYNFVELAKRKAEADKERRELAAADATYSASIEPAQE